MTLSRAFPDQFNGKMVTDSRPWHCVAPPLSPGVPILPRGEGELPPGRQHNGPKAFSLPPERARPSGRSSFWILDLQGSQAGHSIFTAFHTRALVHRETLLPILSPARHQEDPSPGTNFSPWNSFDPPQLNIVTFNNIKLVLLCYLLTKIS